MSTKQVRQEMMRRIKLRLKYIEEDTQAIREYLKTLN